MTAISLPSRKLILLSGSLIPSWLPLAGGTVPTLFADFTTEGSGNHYWFSGAQYQGFAAWNTAIGGTFSRASSATYLQGGVVKSALSNAVRFPSDISSVPTGLRLTGAGTNLVLQSGDISNAAWSQEALNAFGSTTTGPDGFSAIKLMVPSTLSTNHDVFQSFTATAQAYTISAVAKAGGYNFAILSFGNLGVNGTWFNLSNGTVATNAVGNTANIVALANGWYKCSITRILSSGTSFIEQAVAQSDGAFNFSGDGASGIYLTDNSLTASAFPLDYIPTTSGTVTQAADALSFPFSAASTLTVVAKATMASFISGARLIGVGSGKLLNQSDSTHGQTDNGINNIAAAVIAWTQANKVGVSGTGSARAIAANNNAAVSDANALLSGAMTTMYVMSDNGSNPSYGDLATLAAWNGLSVSNAALQGLTI